MHASLPSSLEEAIERKDLNARPPAHVISQGVIKDLVIKKYTMSKDYKKEKKNKKLNKIIGINWYMSLWGLFVTKISMFQV